MLPPSRAPKQYYTQVLSSTPINNPCNAQFPAATNEGRRAKLALGLNSAHPVCGADNAIGVCRREPPPRLAVLLRPQSGAGYLCRECGGYKTRKGKKPARLTARYQLPAPARSLAAIWRGGAT
jgi:hypothetical protein